MVNSLASASWNNLHIPPPKCRLLSGGFIVSVSSKPVSGIFYGSFWKLGREGGGRWRSWEGKVEEGRKVGGKVGRWEGK